MLVIAFSAEHCFSRCIRFRSGVIDSVVLVVVLVVMLLLTLFQVILSA